MFTEARNHSEIAGLALCLANLLRDRFQIDGQPSPPNGGATDFDATDAIGAIFNLQCAMPARGGDRVMTDADWEQARELERIGNASVKIRAMFGEEREGAEINVPPSIPAELVKALEYGARVLAERQESVTPPTDEKQPETDTENGHPDTENGHDKKTKKKNRPLYGEHWDCIHKLAEEANDGSREAVESFVIRWVELNAARYKKQGITLRPQGFLKKIQHNKTEWEHLLKPDTKRTPRR